MASQAGFFDFDERLVDLSTHGDPLERIAGVVDFEVFRADLNAALGRSERREGRPGRPPLDPVMMFKILILQALYGLSDEQAEFQIKDRLSFMRFLGLDLAAPVPDYSSVWRFREALVEASALEALFTRFDQRLRERGYLAMGGQMLDASVIEAPKQRMTREEKDTIKGGGTPPWPRKKAAHKDKDARWTLKRGRVKKRPEDEACDKTQSGLVIPAFGYKSHINVDQRYRLIRRWTVTPASAHDGARLPDLLNADAFGSKVWADTAYRSKKNEAAIAKAGRVSLIHFKKPPGRPMPGPHQRANRARSKIRSAVEHVFAEQKARMGLFVRTVGIDRAKAKIGLANLAYNMKRLVFLETQAA